MLLLRVVLLLLRLMLLVRGELWVEATGAAVMRMLRLHQLGLQWLGLGLNLGLRLEVVVLRH